MTDQQVEAQVSSIGRRAGRGLRWALGGNLVMKVGSFALSLVMVRLLAPHDFGLYAVALAANAFLIHVNDMGMIAATVQWRGEVDEMAATATTMAIAFSLAWYGLFWIGAPILADAAGSPEATTSGASADLHDRPRRHHRRLGRSDPASLPAGQTDEGDRRRFRL